MYGFSKNFDFDLIIDIDILQICFGQNEIIINFDNNVSACITSNISCGGEKCARYADIASELCNLLLYSRIVEARVEVGNKLILKTDKGNTVEIYDDECEYESFVLTHNGVAILVV